MPTPGYSLLLFVGRRYFRPVTPHALLFATPAVDLSAEHTCNSTSTCTSGWTAGLGFGFGGEYLLTPFLGVGVEGFASISYGPTKILSGGVTTTDKAFHANFSTPAGLLAFLHF